MIQRVFTEIKRNGNWRLYRVDYFYKDRPCMYYELRKKGFDYKTDDILRFGSKKLVDLKKLMVELNLGPLDMDDNQVVVPSEGMTKIEDWY